MIEKLVSGGQTGVDRAALDVALRLGIACAGWCPRGRRAEDYPERTLWNVRDSDGTLLLTAGAPDGGTAYTIVCAKQLYRPYLALDLLQQPRVESARAWIKENAVRVLNIAGPRESTSPGIYRLAADFLESLLVP